MSTKTLTVMAAEKAQPRDRKYKLAAGGGLYLEVMPSGAKYWRWKYRHNGAEKRIALGVFPDVSLADARQLRDEERAKLRDGIDPAAERRSRKAAARLGAGGTFRELADEWLAKQKASLAPVTYGKAEWLLTLLAPLHVLPIANIGAPEVLAALRRIEATGTIETAHRARQKAGAVFRYAVATGRAQRDPTMDLRGALAPVVTKSHAAITDPAKIAELLHAIDGYIGQPTTAAALKLAPMLFVRPGNLRAMEWAEIDLDAAEWRIPAGKMKMRDPHVVPLPSQAVAILRELHPLTGVRGYVFPSLRTPDRPLSENTVNAALRRLGYTTEQMTGHGFRALASTRLNEMGWSPDVIERQLAHAERNKVRAVYNRAQYLAERTKMMQAWADYLDGLRTSANVVPIKKIPAKAG